MKVSPIPTVILAIISLCLPGCSHHIEEHEHAVHKIVATNPQCKSVTITEPYVCQIHSYRHIEVRALEKGYLEKILVKEGQLVKEGESLFTVIPILYQTKLDAENAEANFAQLEYNYTKKLAQDKVVSPQELALLDAKLMKANAKAQMAKAELNFTNVKASYDGIIDRQHHQQGSLVDEGEVLTTLSDNSVMWVYFNVPEANYLEYMATMKGKQDDLKIELVLANGNTFSHTGKIGAIEADFNNQTGNIAFRADFANPDRLLRHGQTGTVKINRVLKDAMVIPQRSTFEVLDKQYVYIIDKDNVVHQQEIEVQEELEDLFVIKKGVSVADKIVFEGVRQMRDGDHVEYENRTADQIGKNLKQHAE
jgi:membrane fusion protein (multidrug efflux system)